MIPAQLRDGAYFLRRVRCSSSAARSTSLSGRTSPGLSSSAPPNQPDGFWVCLPIAQPNGAELGSGEREEGRQCTRVCWLVQASDTGKVHLWRYLKAMEG